MGYPENLHEDSEVLNLSRIHEVNPMLQATKSYDLNGNPDKDCRMVGFM
jgi:hypothetical protein